MKPRFNFLDIVRTKHSEEITIRIIVLGLDGQYMYGSGGLFCKMYPEIELDLVWREEWNQ